MHEFGIGGQERPMETNEGIADIPQNRTLLIQKLTAVPDPKPRIIHGLTSVDDVFENYQPKAKIEFTDSAGASIKEEVSFNNIGDFGKKGITHQSQFLKDLKVKQEEYKKFIKNLRSNKILQNLLNDPEAKKAYLDALKAAIAEIEASDAK